MKNKISIIVFGLTMLLFSGCANSDYYLAPESSLTTYELTPTTTVAAENTAATASPTQYTEEKILEAFVTSSDEKGTFYKSISFQSIPTDGAAPIGFSVPINVTTLYGKGFTPGRKVYIQLKGLYRAKVYGALQIGSLYDGTIGRISEFEWKNHLFPSATIVSEDNFVRTLSLATAFTDANQNTLIELKNVQFEESSLGRTYYDIDSGGGATNHTLGSTVAGGGSGKIIRFSSFAPFTGNNVPSLSGTIRGVLTKYNTDFQFIVRYENDIKLDVPRIYISSPLGGTNITYTNSLSEPFTSFAVNNTVFPKYINDQTIGNRYWQVKQFPSGTGNKYIEMSSFGGGGVNAKSYFMVPVNFTTANNFTFKEEIRYYKGGAPLKVYYVKSENFVAGSLDLRNFRDITDKFSITYPSIDTSENSFNSAGTYPIPAALDGTGFFVFEYTGTPTLTTTVQLDDITIN